FHKCHIDRGFFVLNIFSGKESLVIIVIREGLKEPSQYGAVGVLLDGSSFFLNLKLFKKLVSGVLALSEPLHVCVSQILIGPFGGVLLNRLSNHLGFGEVLAVLFP